MRKLIHSVVFTVMLGLVGVGAELHNAGAEEDIKQQQEAMASHEQSLADAVYRLGSGDALRMTVFGEQDLSGEFKVDGGGNVSLPLIGKVKLGGLTLREAEEQIGNTLKGGYIMNPKVSLEVTNYRPFYILGEVKQPGSYPYVEGMKAINAVALAGGFTHRADEKHFELNRGGTSNEKIEVVPETVLLPGDVVEVQERFF